MVAICDGSPDQGEGFAAAFVCTGIPLAGRCSLRLQMDGSETAELGSMLLALLHVFQAQAERPCGSVVFMCDSRNAVKHVFEESEPSKRDGTHLYAGILACRYVIRRLRACGVPVCGHQVCREQTKRAHVVAQTEMRRRRSGMWCARDDHWEEPLTAPLKGIFEHMAMQRRRGDWAPREMPQGIQAELDTILGIV